MCRSTVIAGPTTPLRRRLARGRVVVPDVEAFDHGLVLGALAEQVLAQRPDATVIMLLPPSPEVQAARLAARGDDDEHILRRVDLGRTEVERGGEIAAHTVVNDDLQRALAELAAIVHRTRSAAPCAANPEES